MALPIFVFPMFSQADLTLLLEQVVGVTSEVAAAAAADVAALVAAGTATAASVTAVLVEAGVPVVAADIITAAVIASL